MKIGICIPNHYGVEDVQSVFQMATRAEELGFDSIWVSEHIFNVSYVFDRLGDRPYYEPLTILSYLAATTKRVGLGTSVLVLPYHNPIRLAKVAATLDVMSEGRLMLGVGVGVIEEELEAMGSTFRERGAITDEAIAVMKELWTQETPSYQGKYHSFEGMRFSPKPLQKPHIPLLVGGSSPGAIRRAARVGNGWHPSNLSPEDLGERLDHLREQARAVGRDLSEIPVSIRLDMAVPTGEGSGDSRARYSLGAEPKEILDNIRAFEAVGVDKVVIAPATGNPWEILAAIEMLAWDVIPSFR